MHSLNLEAGAISEFVYGFSDFHYSKKPTSPNSNRPFAAGVT